MWVWHMLKGLNYIYPNVFDLYDKWYSSIQIYCLMFILNILIMGGNMYKCAGLIFDRPMIRDTWCL